MPFIRPRANEPRPETIFAPIPSEAPLGGSWGQQRCLRDGCVYTSPGTTTAGNEKQNPRCPPDPVGSWGRQMITPVTTRLWTILVPAEGRSR